MATRKHYRPALNKGDSSQGIEDSKVDRTIARAKESGSEEEQGSSKVKTVTKINERDVEKNVWESGSDITRGSCNAARGKWWEEKLKPEVTAQAQGVCRGFATFSP